jgi:type III pantothenate kinase
MKLLIDCGNMRLKWALCEGARLHAVTAMTHAEFAQVGTAAWRDIAHIDAIWIAAVAGAAQVGALLATLRATFASAPRLVHSSAQACGVRNGYALAEHLGVDRFLGMIAAHARAPQATVIASCGTALTLDALGADGRHLGGLIAASPALAQSALRNHTGQLGAAPAGAVVELADNTADAIESGTWLGAAALVERFCAQAARRMGSAPALLLSGGGSQRLGAVLALPHRIETDLVLRGLAHYAESAR